MNSKVQDLLKQLEERMSKIDRTELMSLLIARTKHHHNYSFSNTLIAGIQLCRQQGRSFDLEVFSNLWLAPFPIWNKWGYRVQRGSKALDILTPIKYKREKNRIEIDHDEINEKEGYNVFFVTKPVFDVSQTEKPVKKDNMFYRQTYTDASTLSFTDLLTKIHAAGIKVELIPLRESIGGYISGSTMTIRT